MQINPSGEISKSEFVVRVCLGFALAPLASIPIIIVASWIGTGRFQAGPLAVVQLAAFAYAATFFFLFILGLPIGYFMVRFWRTSILDFSTLGAAAGPALVLLIVTIFGRPDSLGNLVFLKISPVLMFSALLGAAETSLFWLIARPDKLQRTSPKSSTNVQLKSNNDFTGE